MLAKKQIMEDTDKIWTTLTQNGPAAQFRLTVAEQAQLTAQYNIGQVRLRASILSSVHHFRLTL